MFEKRINIFTGHFGSGKTEVAVNYACKLSEIYSQTAIVDFDIVNPFFRTADAKVELEKRGIKVILPIYANTNVDVPALPGEINSLFERKEFRVVFDVGGDDLGARAISRYMHDITADDYELFFVVNTNRPMTDDAEKIKEMISDIENSSRMKITKLINNTNLLGETTIEDIVKGQEIIEEVAKDIRIPVEFISGFEEIAAAAGKKLGLDYLSMTKLIKLPWQ